jgi:maltose-binding protein MalE
MISMIPTGKGRPILPEYQAIAEHVRQALDWVFYGIKRTKTSAG